MFVDQSKFVAFAKEGPQRRIFWYASLYVVNEKLGSVL